MKELGECTLGDFVSFHVRLSADGAPVAVEIRGLASGTASPNLEEEGSMSGTVCERNEGAGTGFLRCPGVQQLCGKDVYFRIRDFPDCQLGDTLGFRLIWDHLGRPRAERQDEEGLLQRLQREHTGVIKEFYPDKGYGFVASDFLRTSLGKDLFFKKSDFDTCVPGATVSFVACRDAEGRLHARQADLLPRKPRQDQVEVSLGPSFGPLGLGLRCGWLPEVLHIREDLRGFWLQQGVCVGDRLLHLQSSSEAVSLEGLTPAHLRPRLLERPLKLVFLCLHDEGPAKG
ncbi:unnamed protein product [Symbiodinium natans]|uniref:Cold-shock domain-containing protein n=1 Tax=Symbiodinium natans TaxID=878477 RepID=A0A812R9C4_9DINO|nr:unnamed protein product [Symbiodinium natans]